MRNIAIVPVVDSLPFEWVSGGSMLSNLIVALDDIRDLDEIVVLARDPEAVNPEMPPTENFDASVKVIKLVPNYTTPIDMMRWYAENSSNPGEDIPKNFLFVDPLFPYLDRSKIEQALYCVMQGKDAAITTRNGCTLSKQKMQPAVVVVEACMALNGNTLSQEADDGYHVGDYTGVPISSVEAVEFRLECGRRIAQALEFTS
jgi:hypothetical protein